MTIFRTTSAMQNFRVRFFSPFLVFALLITVVATSHSRATAQQTETKKNSIGKQIASQSIKDINGTPTDLVTEDVEATVVVFLGWECPLVRQYVPRLKELQSQFQDKNVRWLTVNSNRHDSLAELQQFARKFEFEMPILKDVGNKVADQFAASRTPEAFLLDSSGKIVYQGRIDDQFTYGRQRPEVTTTFLANAIEQTLAGKAIEQSFVEAEGCIIGRIAQTTNQSDDNAQAVTYSNQISRILQKNCASCHRTGEIGPFALMEYEEVAGWAGMIQEVVNERRMPPWHADPKHGSFSNDSRLSEDDIELINQWVKAGAPEGDAKNLPEPIVYTDGWQIGEPDLIVPMKKRPYKVPATGTVDYEYFQVDPGFKEDKWVCAAECREGNRAVIHHIIVGIRGEGDFGRGVHDGVNSDWIAASAPGSPPMILPEGYAKLIPAGSKLIFQMHYTPNGTPAEDISSIGLKFLDADKVTHRVATWKAFEEDFRIPPGDSNHEVKAQMHFRRDAELISLFPHMHLRGKAFKYTASYPNGEDEILLNVPQYDFNWQNGYELNKRKLIPKGTIMRCVAHFDNSENNLANQTRRNAFAGATRHGKR